MTSTKGSNAPRISRAIAAGLEQSRSNFVIRLVNWQSNHDIAKEGWSIETVREIAQTLAAKGKPRMT